MHKLNLTYKGEEIGVLSFDGSEYRFEYTPKFDELKLHPLPGVEYPTVSSKVLWSYFASRIPNIGSPLYKRLVASYNLTEEEQKCPMMLLKTVGSKVATDPFVIE